MKRLCLILFLVSVFPISVFATSYTFDESGGSLNFGQTVKAGAPLQLSGAKIVTIQGPGVHMTTGPALASLGRLSIGNAHLISETTNGSEQAGSITDTYKYGAGTINIINYLEKSPLPRGTVFNGTFSAETLTVTYDYTKEENSKGKAIYVFDGRTWNLTGNMAGTLYTGQKLSGRFDITKVGSSTTGVLSSAPEPRTLALLATGLLGIAGLVRRRRG